MDDIRIDKWLWAARFFKTRSLAQAAIAAGHVLVAGESVKLSRAVRLGDEVRVRAGNFVRSVIVLAVSNQRGSATVAQTLYQETPESIRTRVEEAARRALYTEPADSIESGRPTKRHRRQLERWRTRG
jgi:ribosome-associated heat shock protein Hsp15